MKFLAELQTIINEGINFKQEAAKHMKDMHNKNATPAAKAYAQKMLQRALEASKMKDKDAATKHYMGVVEGTNQSVMANKVKDLLNHKEYDKAYIAATELSDEFPIDEFWQYMNAAKKAQNPTPHERAAYSMLNVFIKNAQQGVAEGSDELYQQAIRKYVRRVANDYLGGGNAHLYGAGNFDSDMFGVDPKQAEQDFDKLFPQYVKKLQGGEQGVAEEVEDVSEVKLDTLRKYYQRSVADLSKRQIKLNTGDGDANDAKKMQDRKKGLNRASSKIAAKMEEGVTEGALIKGYIVKNGSKYLKGHPAGGGQMTWVADKAKATVFKSKGEISRAANMRGWSIISAEQGVAEGQTRLLPGKFYVVRNGNQAARGPFDDEGEAEYAKAEYSKGGRRDAAVAQWTGKDWNFDYMMEQGVAEAKGALTYTPEFKKWAVIPKSRRQFVTFFKPSEEKKAQEFAQNNGGRLVKVDQMDRVIKDSKKA